MRANVTTPVIAPNQPENFFDLLGQGVCEATFDLALRFFARQKVLSGMSGASYQVPARRSSSKKSRMNLRRLPFRRVGC